MTPRAIARLAAAVLAAGIVGPASAGFAQEDPELSEGAVEVVADVRDDSRIEARLDGLFDSIGSLAAARAEVEAGVVRLYGEVPSASAREIAGDLAKRIEGVVAVENELVEDRSVATRVDQAAERLAARGREWLAGLPLAGVAILAAVLVFAVGRLLTRWDAPFERLTANPFVRDLTRQAVRVAFGLAGLLVALEILDATALIGALLGAAGVVSLALGFAFRDLIENYVASVLLSLRQPFLPNDHVKIADHEGLVARLTSRATHLLTFDGNHVRIPNATVFKGTIENFTLKPERRFSFAVGLGVDEDVTSAQDLGCRILGDMPGVLDDPEPRAVVDELGDSNVALRFYGWVDQRVADFAKVRSEAIRLVKQAFDAEQIDMPEPIQRVRLSAPDADEAAADRPSRPAPAKAAPARDVSRDRHLDEELAEERREQGDDLLEEGAPRE
ncbi:MAG: mechanosensitive ion channel domain-containing protein [Myxococcota bacterium]